MTVHPLPRLLGTLGSVTGMVLGEEGKDKSSQIKLGKPGVTGDLSKVPWIRVLSPFDFYVKTTASITFK